MEELFRFIQQAVVVPADGRQIDLTADTKFQRDLKGVLSKGAPHSALRDRAAAFLNYYFAGASGADADGAEDDAEGGAGGEADAPPGEEYARDRLARLGKYVQLRDNLLALLTSEITDEKVNQAVKDVFGKYAGELVNTDPDLKTDKNFSSDILVAVKLVTRFDQLDVTAVTTMRRVVAFIEDVAAGVATAGWHPLQLAPASTAADGSHVASVSRDPAHMNAWWIGRDAKVQGAEWGAGYGWQPPAPIPNVNDASTTGGVAAVSRDAAHIDVWWIKKDGSVQVAEWTDGHGWAAHYEVAGPGSASTSSGLAALSRSPSHMEVWWIGNNGSVHNAWWTQDGGWKVNPNPLAGNDSASTSSGIAVLSRSSTHMEVWWIGKNRSVQGAWWIKDDGWHGPYPVADPDTASASSGVAAVSRVSSQMDVLWIGKDGSVQDGRWTKAEGWQRPRQVANRDSASASSGIAALSRASTHMQVWWIGEDRSVQEARWASDGWHEPRAVAEANSAASSSGVTALSRVPTHMELWWIGKDRSVQDAWWLDLTPPTPAAERIRTLLERGLHFPDAFLPQASGQTPGPAPVPPAPAGDGGAALIREYNAFRGAYDALMSARPAQLAIKMIGPPDSDGDDGGGPRGAADQPRLPNAGADEDGPDAGQEPEQIEKLPAARSVLGVSEATLESMDSVVTEHLQGQLNDPGAASLQDILHVVKQRWLEVSRELWPLRAQRPARIYRLGINLFAVQEPQPGTALAKAEPPPMPDFSHAVTRPVGVGDLQVVRQRLIGYEAADISHIESVLPGELLRRTTLREETTERIVTEESETTQSAERDTQTTERNELVAEAQKEASQQSTTTTDQTSSSNYGRLVENSKTNYARGVTDRAVNKLTQLVRQQRVQREKKLLSDQALHQLDNSTGQKAVRGIYQWVDKKYQVQVFNYGKRLLYDIVIPEPAAFLINALKTAAQEENFQLTKPIEPGIMPWQLDEYNYDYYAALYGVTGTVTPPPAELVTTFAEATNDHAGQLIEAAYAKKWNSQFFSSFKIRVPEGYSAIGGYVQRTNRNLATGVGADPQHRKMEFFIGQYEFIEFSPAGVNYLNHSFTMNGETGDIPVTVRTYANTLQFNYAVGINCRRTDKAYAQWQLTTHAAIVAGYQRQRAAYLDELSRYQAAVRTQMALASGFSRDSAIERQELKKAFIHLLIGEHYAEAYFPPPYDPTSFPPDPEYIKKWGAVTAFFERAFEWEHLMYLYYPYFWGRQAKWGELILIQDLDPQFEAFLKAGAAGVVIPVRPGFEAALAHYHETGDVWMGEEIPDMFSEQYVSIIAEIKARNAAPGEEVCVDEWEVRLPTTLVIAREDSELPKWPAVPRHTGPDA